MSFWDYQPEEYEQFFLSKQEEAVREVLSTPDIRVSEYKLSVELVQEPYKLSVYIQPSNMNASVWAYFDSEGLPLLRTWMEDMSNYSSSPKKMIKVVGDGISFILSYTHIGSLDIAGRQEPLVLILYLGWDFTAMVSNVRGNPPFSSLVVPLRSFLSDLYYRILYLDGLRDQFYSIKSYKLENNLKILGDNIKEEEKDRI